LLPAFYEGSKKRKLDEIVHAEIDVLVEQINSLNEGVKKLDEQIKDHGQKMDGHKNLTSISWPAILALCHEYQIQYAFGP